MNSFFAVYNSKDELVGTFDSYEKMNKLLKKKNARNLESEVCRLLHKKIDYIKVDGESYKIYKYKK